MASQKMQRWQRRSCTEVGAGPWPESGLPAIPGPEKRIERKVFLATIVYKGSSQILDGGLHCMICSLMGL
eukprot:scaffold37447_cov16-Tisochrysis_lutea.AAC.1